MKPTEVDKSLQEVDISLPEEKIKVKRAERENEAPEMEIEVKDSIVSPSRFKMPTIKFPKFGASTPNVTAEKPDVKKDIQVSGSKTSETNLTMTEINIEKPNVDIKRQFIDVDVETKKHQAFTVKEAEVEVQPPSVELKVSSGEAEKPEGAAKETDVKTKKPKMSFGWFSKPEVKASEVDVSLPEMDVSLMEKQIEVKKPDVEITAPEMTDELKHDIEVDGQGSKFKLPKFGISMPKVTGPQIDLGVSKKEIDVTLPGAKVEVQPPNVELQQPSGEVNVPEGAATDADVKMKNKFKLPKFGISMPKLQQPSGEINVPEGAATDVDVKMKKPHMSFGWFSKAEVKSPEVDVSLPKVDISLPEGKVEVDGQGSKFKLPKFGISMPKVTGPQIDLGVSKKEIDVTLPGAKVEVQPPNVELQQPSGEVNVPEGPHMSFGWFSKAEVKSPEVDVSLPKVDISLPKAKVEVKKPDVEMTAPEMTAELKHDIEVDGQGSKFKLPKFGISMPKVTGPQIDLGVSKKEIDVTLPGAKVEVQPPNVELQQPSGEINVPEGAATDVDVKMKKPHMSFGWFSKAEVKSPEVDVSLPKVDISLPEGKVEVKKPDVEMTAPEMTAELKHDVEVEGPGSKFKLPKFGISMSKVKGPQIDLGVSKKEIDVTLPGSKVEVQPPNVELQQPSGEVNIPEGAATDVDVKMKKPPMSFGWFSKAEVKSPEVDVSHPKVDISLPEGKVEVKKPDVEITAPEMTVELKHDIEVDAQGSKFKLPKFGISMPKVKGPQIDLGVSKKEIDVTLPGAKVEVQPPNVEPKLPSGEVNIPEGAATDVDPPMSFGWFSKAEVKSPDVDVSLPKVDISLPEGKVEVKKPDVEITAPEMTAELKHDIEVDAQGSKFKLPKFGISMPKVKGPQIDLGVSKKEIDPHMSFGWFSKAEVKSPDVDVSLPKEDISLPEGKVEVKKPDVEMTAPEMTAEVKHDIELQGQGSKFKLPKFGISMPKVTGPQIDLGVSKKEIDVTLPGAKVEVQPPNVELQQPSGEVNVPEGAATDVDVKMKKPHMSFGWFSKAEVKSPEVDVSLPKVDISLPEGKVEVKKPDVEITAPEMTAELKHDIEVDAQGSKFKLPKFGISMPKVKGPQIDLGVSKKEIDVTLPGAKVEVQPPNVELQQPSGEVNVPEGAATDVDVKMKKPHMSFGWFSKAEVKSPEVDVSLPKVDISLPEGKVEVKKPDVEITAPEMTAELKHDIEVDAQGSKFKLPKFGISMPKVKGPQIDLGVSKKEIDVTLPGAKVEVQPPNVELQQPSGEVNVPEGAATDADVKMKKPHMSFGWFSKAEVKSPEVDVSLPKVDISLPKAKPPPVWRCMNVGDVVVFLLSGTWQCCSGCTWVSGH
uniref:Uncharacterized protein n=1 Tax=Esox lucius TaxID=8010 RepID=A0AAY5KEM6_ESOLU